MTEKKETNKPVKKVPNIFQKLNKAIKHCADNPVQKNLTGAGYSTANYNDVQKVCRDACLENGLFCYPTTSTEVRDDGRLVTVVVLTVVDIDNGHRNENGAFVNDFVRCGDVKVTQKLTGNQNDPKISGSILTYGYRYLLQKFFLLAIEESQDLETHKSGDMNPSGDGFDLTKLKQ